MALTIGPAPAAATDRGVVPSPWWPRRQLPTADEQPISRVSAGRRSVSTGRSTPTPARVPTAESVPAAQRAVVWRAGTLTVPKPDRLIVRLVRTGTLVAATAVASATLLHAVSTWSVLPGVGPTPASRLWFAPVHTATEDRSPLGQGAADAFPVTFTPARTGAELPTTSTTPRLPPIHTAATSTDAGARSVGGPSDELATQPLAVEQTEPAKPSARLPRDSDKRPAVVPAAKSSVAKPTTAKPSTPVAPRDSSKRPEVVPAAKPSVAKPTKAKASTPVSPRKPSKKLTAAPTAAREAAPATSGKASGADAAAKKAESTSARADTSPRESKQPPRTGRSAPQTGAQDNKQPPK